MPTELDWKEVESRVWAVSPHATTLGGHGRCQELAGIRVQSGSPRRDSHLGKVCEPTDSCLAWLGLAGSFSGRDEWELGSWLRADSEM